MSGVALLGGRVLPMTRPDAVAQAVAWEDGRIVFVGDEAGARQAARDRGLEMVDMGGRVVVPGFVDAHTHLLHEGMKGRRPDLSHTGSATELLETVAAWIHAHGSERGPLIGEGFDESGWDRPRLPTREELDAVTEGRAVAVRRVCGHVAVANTAALAAVQARWHDPAEVHPDTGLLLESPSLYLNEALPASAAAMDEALVVACRAAHRLGVTAVGDYAQGPNRAALQRAAAMDRLRLRVHCSIYVQQLDEELRRGFRTGRAAVGRDDPEADPRRWMPSAGPEPAGTGGPEDTPADALEPEHFAPVPGPSGGSSAWLTDGGLKVFLDGSIGGHTAYLRRPYADKPTRGMRNWSDAEVRSWFQRGHAAGIQIHAHAIGDGAIEQALDAFAALGQGPGREAGHETGRRTDPGAGRGTGPAARTEPREGGAGPGAVPRTSDADQPRHRIEHYELASDDLVQRTVELGVVASCQPNFVGEWSQAGGMYERRLGERFVDNNRYRTWSAAGLRICFGSDGMPFGPLYGIECATLRPDKQERIPVAEALWRYTAEAAWSLQDGSIGRLVPGNHADVVVLETHNLEGPPTGWGIHATFAAGEPMLAIPPATKTLRPAG